MELLRCHIELLTQLVDLLARNHVETYMYNSFKPCGHINKTSGPTYILSRPTCKLTDGFIHRHNGHTCNPTNLFTDPMDILATLQTYLQTLWTYLQTLWIYLQNVWNYLDP
jgi:hypothetical protein